MAVGCSTKNLITGDNTISGVGKTYLIYAAVDTDHEIPVGYCLRTLSTTDDIDLKSDGNACSAPLTLTQGVNMWLTESLEAKSARVGFGGIINPIVTGPLDLESKTVPNWFALAYSDFVDSGTMHVWDMQTNEYYTDSDVDSGPWSGDAIYTSLGTNNFEEVFMAEGAIVSGNLSLAQLTGWARGQYPPFNIWSGDMLFYQPLVTGANEEGYIGVDMFPRTGAALSVTGHPSFFLGFPVGSSTNIETNGAINLVSRYSQVESGTSGILTNSDVGKLDYTLIYESGDGLGEVSNIYHTSLSILSGEGVSLLNLTSLSYSPINVSFTKSMTRIKSFSVYHESGTGNAYMDFTDINKAKQAKEIFGNPSGILTLPANSCFHVNDGTSSGYVVDNDNKFIVFSGDDTDVSLNIVIMGDN